MRTFLDGILSFIGAVSLSDEEFALIEAEDQEYSLEVYNALSDVLDSRESVSTMQEKLEAFFIAKGVEVSENYEAKSNVLIGGGLCD
jgi:hypothetical protein